MKRRLTSLPGLVLLSVLGSSHAVASARTTAPSAGIEPWMVGYWKVSKNEDQSESGGGTASYTYDPLYRLTAHEHGTATRTYDANGNTTGNSAAGTMWGYGYNGRKSDDRGNLTSPKAFGIGWSTGIEVLGD